MGLGCYLRIFVKTHFIGIRHYFRRDPIVSTLQNVLESFVHSDIFYLLFHTRPRGSCPGMGQVLSAVELALLKSVERGLRQQAL